MAILADLLCQQYFRRSACIDSGNKRRYVFELFNIVTCSAYAYSERWRLHYDRLAGEVNVVSRRCVIGVREGSVTVCGGWYVPLDETTHNSLMCSGSRR